MGQGMMQVMWKAKRLVSLGSQASQASQASIWLLLIGTMGLMGLALAGPVAAQSSETAQESAVEQETESTAVEMSDTPKAGSSDQRTEQVKERFRERFGNMPVTEVRHTDFGLFEVQLGSSLVYTDEPVTFVLDGHLIDASTRADVTEQRLEVLSRIDFDDLPLSLAITQVRGDGSRRMAIFEDPNCGYCKQLRRNMEGINDLTIHTFLLPILSADSTEKVKNVWCAEDQNAVWDDWMLLGVEPPAASCEAPIDDFLSLARSLNIEGTPAIFFEDGSRVPGAISQEALVKRLE